MLCIIQVRLESGRDLTEGLFLCGRQIRLFVPGEHRTGVCNAVFNKERKTDAIAAALSTMSHRQPNLPEPSPGAGHDGWRDWITHDREFKLAKLLVRQTKRIPRLGEHPKLYESEQPGHATIL